MSIGGVGFGGGRFRPIDLPTVKDTGEVRGPGQEFSLSKPTVGTAGGFQYEPSSSVAPSTRIQFTQLANLDSRDLERIAFAALLNAAREQSEAEALIKWAREHNIVPMPTFQPSRFDHFASVEEELSLRDISGAGGGGLGSSQQSRQGSGGQGQQQQDQQEQQNPKQDFKLNDEIARAIIPSHAQGAEARDVDIVGRVLEIGLAAKSMQGALDRVGLGLYSELGHSPTKVQTLERFMSIGEQDRARLLEDANALAVLELNSQAAVIRNIRAG